MPLFHLVVLAVIQGLTEFLPVSSSGHLVLYPLLTGAPDQGRAIDVAVHVGALGAVMVYFRAEVATMLKGALDLARGRAGGAEAGLTLRLIVATLPLIAFGAWLAASGADEALRSVALIGWTTLIGGVVLWLADRMAERGKSLDDWSWRDAVLMGLAQCAALAPGVSRSGAAITAARALGYTRVEAARIAMLMSIPAIGAAGAYIAVKLIRAGDAALGADAALAAVLSFAAALAALAVMMRMLRTWTMAPFAIYRLILGAALLAVAYS